MIPKNFDLESSMLGDFLFYEKLSKGSKLEYKDGKRGEFKILITSLELIITKISLLVWIKEFFSGNKYRECERDHGMTAFDYILENEERIMLFTVTAKVQKEKTDPRKNSFSGIISVSIIKKNTDSK